MIRSVIAIAAVLLSSPVLAAQTGASASIELPDPSGVTLLAIGVAGLVIGRYLARNKGD